MFPRIPSRIPGFDEILHGGFIPRRMYLLSGEPGVGKTTIGLCFLREGIRQGEKALCISLSEPVVNLIENASSIGIDVSGAEFLDLSPTQEFFVKVETYDLFLLLMWSGLPPPRRFLKWFQG
ncbi:MAG: ATPase domain-containing protein [Candidatus Caldatribacteriaceae bacterium]